ncbi:hypothetical protein CFP65_2823 [Kitasatospora sp. MMS16-BH015]|uniref:hypothetical protein n=1 Tax=Kitasatospora sp. MMS16-BH015 TaxID=2018025 RepID=UPI000CA1E729|nr:hypothetical protein [Kitasatospora sp. MMS16-BH015]AUG77639.1 hypothetical protein CFP65_2823 [Kitasatospora sp. MMS16-BH015]
MRWTRQPAAVWWRLLLVQAVFGGVAMVVGWGQLPLAVLTGGPAVGAAGVVLLLATLLLTAWCWHAKLNVLAGARGFGAVLRADPGRLGPLWCWLLVLDVENLLRLLLAVDVHTYAELVFSPGMTLFRLAGIVLLVVSALLPMTTVLEGRGPTRAWRLACGNWRTALQLVALVVSQQVALFVQGRLAIQALRPNSQAASGVFVFEAESYLLGTLSSVLYAVLLYSVYRSARPARAVLGPDAV